MWMHPRVNFCWNFDLFIIIIYFLGENGAVAVFIWSTFYTEEKDCPQRFLFLFFFLSVFNFWNLRL